MSKFNHIDLQIAEDALLLDLQIAEDALLRANKKINECMDVAMTINRTAEDNKAMAVFCSRLAVKFDIQIGNTIDMLDELSKIFHLDEIGRA